jgi:hypothetical protein
MSRSPRGSRQNSQKYCRSNANTTSAKGISSSRSALRRGVEAQTASAVEPDAEDTNSKASFVAWEERENADRPTTGDKTTVAGVVADNLLQKAKLVDCDFNLGYNETDGTICEFVTTYCSLQANIDVCTWWKEACKWIPTYMSCLRNDKSMAMKWAFLGT